MKIKEFLKTGIILMLFGAGAALVLTLTFVYTQPLIAKEAALELEAALKSVLPKAAFIQKINDNEYSGWLKPSHLSQKDNFAGKIFKVTPQGYSGPITMLVGINRQGQVAGIKVLSLSETPGLGSQAAQPGFLNQFVGKSKKAKLKPKEDIDAIAGATITTQAVCHGVRQALEQF
jgi:electron transport complex protein RnfG